MTRRIYWGLVILILLIIGVTVVMLTRTTDTEPRTIYIDVDPSKPGNKSSEKLSETKKFTKWFEENGATLVSDDAKQVKGDIPDEQEADKTPDWHSLTPEQQQYIYDQFYVQFGLKVPPRGYDYHWKEPGVPYLDENGKPVLRRLDEPIIRVNMGIDFAPTKEELEKYKDLMWKRGLADTRGDVNEVKRLDAEMDALEASAQRMRPVSVTSSSITNEARSKIDRMSNEAMRSALREHGLEHLISYEFWDK